MSVKKHNMKKIYYIGFYSDPSENSCRKAAPSADTKMNYIVRCMKELGYDVEVISFCAHTNENIVFGKRKGYVTYRDGVKVSFFTTYVSKYRILRFLGRIVSWKSKKKILSEICRSDGEVVVYHSLSLLRVLHFLRRRKKKFILELEEIYADVIGKSKLRKRELAASKLADGYIFPTKLLDLIVNEEKKKFVIIHGTYHVEPKYKKDDYNQSKEYGEKIHCVYAGTLDPRKGGASSSAAAAAYLPENYHIHILGFGGLSEIENMKSYVSEISQKACAEVTYDGCLVGEEYLEFIQQCDIGLSTQDPNAAFNSTSFPSKILSYMSNGLRVVSVRIPAIETSEVGKYLYYYDEQTPKKIADAILSVKLNDGFDSRKVISDLNKKNLFNMQKLLEG